MSPETLHSTAKKAEVAEHEKMGFEEAYPPDGQKNPLTVWLGWKLNVQVFIPLKYINFNVRILERFSI